MILDYLDRAARYNGLDAPFQKAFAWLRETDLAPLTTGRHEIDGDRIFAMVNAYDTVDPSGEKMEAHRAHIDLQYMVRGTELVGHDFLRTQEPSKAYDPDKDFMLFDETPSFFSLFQEGMFAIFYPEDLHMPNIRAGSPGWVKKVVVKIKI